MKHLFSVISLCAGLLGVLIFILALTTPPEEINRSMQAAIFFIESVSVEDLQNNYWAISASPFVPEEKKIRVLIVPGHDSYASGTEFNGLTEAEMTAELGMVLRDFFKTNEKFNATLLRDATGYLPEFQDYINKHTPEIEAFIKSHVETMNTLVAQGAVERQSQIVGHGRPNMRVVNTLYGINKWASEKDFDIVIHIHFNDYVGRKRNQVGKHSGFSIYVPEHQYSNAKASRAVAEAVRGRLEQFQNVSTFGTEKAGVIEDQDLIAIGAKNTLDPASLLIEYGYVYEPEFVDGTLRPLVFKNLAYQTYAGVLDFFQNSTPKNEIPFVKEVRNLDEKTASKADVFLLQTNLRAAGFFPPNGKTLVDCPIAGGFGPCTKEALKAYQVVRQSN